MSFSRYTITNTSNLIQSLFAVKDGATHIAYFKISPNAFPFEMSLQERAA